MTKAEKRLWYDYLHDHPARFSRQKVLGKYIADFYSAQAKLVIELDGSQHYYGKNMQLDEERTKYLAQYDLRVIRIPNNVVLERFSDVCAYLEEELACALRQDGDHIQ